MADEVEVPRQRRPGLRFWVTRVASCLALAGLLWRSVRFALGFPPWGDEAFVAVNFFLRDLRGLLRPLEYWQIAPFGFMAAELGVSKLVGCSPWALRLLPFLAGVGSLALFWWFAGRQLDRWSALFALAIFAASYYPVRHSAEIKPYATDLFVALAVTCLAWSVWSRPESSARWLALSFAAAMGVWLSYPCVFTAGCVGVLLGWQALRSRSIRLCAWSVAYSLALTASFGAMLLLYAQPHAQAAPMYNDMITWKDAFPPLAQPWKLPWWLIQVHTGYMLAYPLGGNHFGSLLTFLCVVRGAIVIGRRQPALVWLLLGPLVFNFVAAALHRYPYGTSPRVALYMAPAFCLLAGAGMASALRANVPRRWAARACLASASFIGLIAVVWTAIDLVEPFNAIEDCKQEQAIRTLASQARAGDRWLVFNGIVKVPRTNFLMIAPWLQSEAEVRLDVLRFAPGPARWITEPGQAQPAPGDGRTWLIVHHTGYRPFPDALVAGWVQELSAQTGPPQRFHFPIDQHQTIEAFAFPAQPAPASPPNADSPPERIARRPVFERSSGRTLW